MESGYKTTEFWLVVVVVVFAIAAAGGWLTSDRIEQAAENISNTAQAVPKLIEVVKKLISNLAPLAVAALSVWAYVRRRADLKVKQIGLQQRTVEMETTLSRARMMQQPMQHKEAGNGR